MKRMINLIAIGGACLFLGGCTLATTKTVTPSLVNGVTVTTTKSNTEVRLSDDLSLFDSFCSFFVGLL